jgi:ribonuclease inhibitor
MMTVTIDCAELKSSADFHARMTQTLRLPGFYGENLDALHDCLTALPQKTTIVLLHTQALIDNLGPYGRAAINAITHAEMESPERLHVVMQ